jgi:hypothetical protein
MAQRRIVMNKVMRLSMAAAGVLSLGLTASAQTPPAGTSGNMTFFVTSSGILEGCLVPTLIVSPWHRQQVLGSGLGVHI